jgi:hypothetical protein
MFQRVRHLLGIDRAVGFTVLARGWSILSGAVTILLIARLLTPAEQGYYYTFYSLVSLQIVFELGFSFVILQLAAHESAQLKIAPDGVISGSEVAHSRLASILQKSILWYSFAALVMAAGLVIAGFYFFSAHHQATGAVAWKAPWIGVVFAAIFTFQMDPIFSFLEGCGFVPQVARLRFAQMATGTTLAWVAFAAHDGLFAPAAMIAGQALAGFIFVFSKRQLLLPLLRRRNTEHSVGWRTEIWPFQWRIAVSCMCTYLVFPLFNPVLFAYRGAAEAGRMGMSLNIANALLAVASAWINTKASPFGNMIARRDFAALDHTFFRTLVQSGALLLFGEAVILSGLFFAEPHFPHLALRMLPIPLFALLMFTLFLSHIAASEAAYLRAHKQEPFLILSVLVGIFTGISTLVNGKMWGASGVVIGFFFCGGLFYLCGGTYIFLRFRRMWHSGVPGPAMDIQELV